MNFVLDPQGRADARAYTSNLIRESFSYSCQGEQH
jgi:hypothetical protein